MPGDQHPLPAHPPSLPPIPSCPIPCNKPGTSTYFNYKTGHLNLTATVYYDELVAKYKLKLEQGGKASGRFIPKPIPASYGKQKMLDQFKRSMDKLVHAIQSKWKEPQLDQYIAPHPLLGKITLRELGYFTSHHTYHRN